LKTIIVLTVAFGDASGSEITHFSFNPSLSLITIILSIGCVYYILSYFIREALNFKHGSLSTALSLMRSRWG